MTWHWSYSKWLPGNVRIRIGTLSATKLSIKLIAMILGIAKYTIYILMTCIQHTYIERGLMNFKPLIGQLHFGIQITAKSHSCFLCSIISNDCFLCFILASYFSVHQSLNCETWLTVITALFSFYFYLTGLPYCILCLLH